VTRQGSYGDVWTFTIEVTKPDNSKETLGPFTSDPVGGGWASYTPTQVGTYSIVAKFAGKTITGLPIPPGYTINTITGAAYVNDTYSASSSNTVYVTVQEQQIAAWPEAPLPTQYWTRPVNDANRNWYPLLGNWLAGAAQMGLPGASGGTTTNFCYSTGPESAHVMWATPMWSGGLIDARFGDTGYQTGHYEGLGFTPPIILDGRIYYNDQANPKRGWYCLDLYTGETLYFHNTTGIVSGGGTPTSSGGGFDAHGTIVGESLAFGQVLDVDMPNQHGSFPYLWSTSAITASGTTASNTWMMFDAYSGDYICSIANVSAGGTAVYGKDGSILRYNIVNLGNTTNPQRYLQVWNTSRAIWWKPYWSANQYWMWRPYQNATFDGNNGFSLNASIPDVQGTVRVVRENQYIIGGTTGKNNGTYTLQGNLWALNLKADSNGVITPTLLWNITFTPPQTVADVAAGMFGAGTAQMGAVDPEDGVFLFSETITGRWWGFSLATGQQLWGPSAPEPAMNFYGMYSNIYQGKLLTCGYGGVLIAYDIKTGKVLWNYTAQQVGYESPYGNFPINIACIADGKIYLVSGEHSPTQPLWRGSYIRCINASNGAELWKVLHWGAGIGGAHLTGMCVVMADGYVVGLNLYDNQVYCYGKGPSATTVTAPNTVITQGQSLMVTGTVTDQSPGAKGTPAIADESMEAWMEYLYMQQGIPGNATGVEVTLDALDPNGNFVHIGTVTSDMSGGFKKMYTPEVPGEYTVIATFAGSASYYSSYAQTYVGVDEAPPATAAPEYPQPIDNTLTILYATIAIIITIVIVGILMLRKRS
jgi:hypothetical protein